MEKVEKKRNGRGKARWQFAISKSEIEPEGYKVSIVGRRGNGDTPEKQPNYIS